jgi:hypothetical protein
MLNNIVTKETKNIWDSILARNTFIFVKNPINGGSPAVEKRAI